VKEKDDHEKQGDAHMILQTFDKIAFSDIQSLVDNKVDEKRSLDFKLCLPGRKDSDKNEFLADISSFANASGGDLIYGVKEEDSVAVGIPGVTVDSTDETILWLENMVRDCIQVSRQKR